MGLLAIYSTLHEYCLLLHYIIASQNHKSMRAGMAQQWSQLYEGMIFLTHSDVKDLKHGRWIKMEGMEGTLCPQQQKYCGLALKNQGDR